MGEITEKEIMLLKAIEEYIFENKFSPTVRELADMLNIKSTSTIHKHLHRLKIKGYIHSHSTMPRTISVLKGI